MIQITLVLTEELKMKIRMRAVEDMIRNVPCVKASNLATLLQMLWGNLVFITHRAGSTCTSFMGETGVTSFLTIGRAFDTPLELWAKARGTSPHLNQCSPAHCFCPGQFCNLLIVLLLLFFSLECSFALGDAKSCLDFVEPQVGRDIRDHLLQPFLAKPWSRWDGPALCTAKSWKHPTLRNPPRPLGNYFNAWLFSLWKIFLMCSAGISPGVSSTHYPLYPHLFRVTPCKNGVSIFFVDTL